MHATGTRPVCVSVVMSVFNGNNYLPEALNSILAQTFKEFELIIVDDGSTDGSRDTALLYAQMDHRIRPVLRTHCGLVSSLNLGCGLASGKYIARLDSDDMAKSWRLEHQVEYLESNPDVVLLGGSVECIDTHGSLLFVMRWPGEISGLSDLMLIDCCVAHTTAMFRRDYFTRVGGYRSEFQHAEDYDLFLRMGDSRRMDNLPIVLGEYRLHADQISFSQTEQQVISAIGARLATRARRSNRKEPHWRTERVKKEDLILLGVSETRIRSLIAEYGKTMVEYSQGCKWSKWPFYEALYRGA